MPNLNLKTNNPAEERIKAYLEENASELLAVKINNGVEIKKDDMVLINKKTLEGFMKYATEEAKKLAEKGASSACVEDTVVYGWAVHYFQEDEIIGTLYSPDGTEYKAPKPVPKSVQRTPAPVKAVAKAPSKSQMSLFEMMTEQEKTPAPSTTEKENSVEEVADVVDALEDEEPTEEEVREAMEELVKEEQKSLPKQASPLYQQYMYIQQQYPHAIIVYRLGDFYEIFGDNAKIIANELDLTLTGRDCGLEERMPMIGFPYHASDAYIKKMIELGHTVAIANGVSDVEVKQPIALAERKEKEQHWIDDTTYADEFGEIHTVEATDNVTNDDLEDELYRSKAFNAAALASLYELLGDEIDLQ